MNHLALAADVAAGIALLAFYFIYAIRVGNKIETTTTTEGQ